MESLFVILRLVRQYKLETLLPCCQKGRNRCPAVSVSPRLLAGPARPGGVTRDRASATALRRARLTGDSVSATVADAVGLSLAEPKARARGRGAGGGSTAAEISQYFTSWRLGSRDNKLTTPSMQKLLVIGSSVARDLEPGTLGPRVAG